MQTPAHEIGVLSRKYKDCKTEDHPATFYGHEGKYNEERAGLYKTDYDPGKLAFKLDEDPSKLNIRNNTQSASNSLHMATPLSAEMDVLSLHNENDMRKVPMFGDQPDVLEVFEPYHRDRFVQKSRLLPTAESARPRIQEGEVVLRASTAGESYNTHKFLQDYSLPQYVRSEPLSLMSKENQNLANVQINSLDIKTGTSFANGLRKSVKFNDQVTVGEGAGNSPLLISQANLENPKVTLYSPRAPTPRNIRPVPSPLSSSLPNISATVDKDMGHMITSMQRSTVPFRPGTSSGTRAKPDYLSTLSEAQHGFLREQVPARNLFESKSSNLGIGGSTSYNLKSSYGQQYQRMLDDSKNDPRFNWAPGCGVPRPQTSLIKIQNSFTKTDAYKRLHEQFPEKNPRLIDNIIEGRQHEFNSLNAQVLRGTLIAS